MGDESSQNHFNMPMMYRMGWFVTIVLLLIPSSASSKNRMDSSIVWFSFSDAWSIVDRTKPLVLSYYDIKRPGESPVNLFCRTKISNNDNISAGVRLYGVIDSIYFGIFIRYDEKQYEFLLTGTDTITSLTIISGTYTVGEYLQQWHHPLSVPVVIDPLWHTLSVSLKDPDISFSFDSLGIGSFPLPFSTDEKCTWGFSAYYSNSSLKDIYLLKNNCDDTIQLPVNTGTVFSAPILKHSRESSDRILGN